MKFRGLGSPEEKLVSSHAGLSYNRDVYPRPGLYLGFVSHLGLLGFGGVHPSSLFYLRRVSCSVAVKMDRGQLCVCSGPQGLLARLRGSFFIAHLTTLCPFVPI